MSYQTNSDNIYKEGSFIYAKEHPQTKLLIVKYYQRIYYCSRVDDPARKELAYFEKELVAPVLT